ncbi:3-hydroxyacyl-CoA dehydrogenase NAD-binding domain-containing protein [Acidisphaera sp. L21]|jgi:carnitine 3-dehydrogenase|uniref:3-hydroxyacyl-CoA dehydrogenase NAD-binding domain-containing protein n=1 Tax=Acidisphaera sp. L21 TaxID=1641851 RepID=UPI00131BFBAF|nr:3-hydroxyacyl-CoA dehydrogenase NAD-binding domain-containing protein [Acidisphaera sp. L21]
MTDPAKVRRVAVIGAGTIGASWAAWFLSRGLQVTVWDPAPEGEAFVRRFIANAWPAIQQLGAPCASQDAISFHATPEQAVAGVQFVQESAPERTDAKRALFAQLEAAMAPDTIVASSSSGLMMTDLAQDLRTPGRFAIGHPFNPPHLIPLVEVVGGQDTTPETIDACLAFYRHIGKHPIRLNKEAPGHLANRLQSALWREAVHAVAEGVASVADVDAAVAYGPGLRWALMGPHLTFHLAGGEGGMAHFIDHLGEANEAWWRSLGQPTLTPEVCRAIIDGVAEETKGAPVPALAAQRDALLVALLQIIGTRRPAQ